MSKVFGMSTEAGRALNMHKALAKELLSPRALVERELLKDPKRFKNIDAVVEGLLRFDPEDKVGIAKYIRSVTPTSSTDFIEAMFYNNILSNPSTHITNQVGNTVRSFWHVLTKPARVGFDIPRAKLTGTAREEFIKEWIPEATGFLLGWRDGAKRATFALQNGFRFGDVEDIGQFAGKGIGAPLESRLGIVGRIWDSPSRLLLAADEMFRGMNRSMDIYRAAANKAVKSGKTGDEFAKEMTKWVNNPSQKMMKESEDLARKLLFQHMDEDVRSLSGIKKLASFNIPKIGEFHPMTFVVPFITTSTNILKFIFEASPLGLGKSLLLDPASGVAGRELNRRLASGLFGTVAMAGLASYFEDGTLTASPPTDKEDRDAWFADGKIPFAAKIGDSWVEYNRIEPLNFWLSTIAAWYDAHQNGKTISSDTVMEVGSKMGKNFLNQSFLRGLNDFQEAIGNPDKASEFLQNRIKGFVPFSGLSGGVARATDRVVREPTSIPEAIKTIIPGLSKQVPSMKTEYEESGEATRHPKALFEFLPTKVSPELENKKAEKRLQQSELIQNGKEDILTRLRKQKAYKNADEKEKQSMEKGVIQSFSRQVRDGDIKSTKAFDLMEYLQNREEREGGSGILKIKKPSSGIKGILKL